jgi:lauroyl/myristoyl acyltransferase/Tfp pilus assembly protein PilF
MLGLTIYNLVIPEKKRITKLLRDTFPEKSPREIDRLFQKIVSNAGKVALEKVMVNEKMFLEYYHQLAGLDRTVEVLRMLSAEGRPHIMVASHMNNVEHLIGFYTRCLATELSIHNYYAGVARLPTAYLDNFAKGVRQDVCKAKFFYSEQAKYYMNKILEDHAIPSLGVDVDVGYKSIFVPFLNRPMAVPPGAAYYALKFDVPIALSKLYFDEHGVQHLDLEVVEIDRVGDMETDIRNLTAELMKKFGELVREYPEQWNGWLQRPWKTRPLEELEASLRQDPHNVNLMGEIGLFHLANGRTEEAKEIFQGALAEAPDYHLAHLQLGRLFLEENETEKATYHLHRALELRPRDGDSRKQIGLLFMKKGLYRTALKYFRAAIRARYDDAESYWGKGRCLEMIGQDRKAIQAYEKGLVVNSHYGPLHLAMAKIYATRPESREKLDRHLFSMKELSVKPDEELKDALKARQ